MKTYLHELRRRIKSKQPLTSSDQPAKQPLTSSEWEEAVINWIEAADSNQPTALESDKTVVNAASDKTDSNQPTALESDKTVVKAGDNSVVNLRSKPSMLTDDNSVVRGDPESKVQSSDKTVVNEEKLMEEQPLVLHRSLWKSLWKTAFSHPQISEIYGLVALCTHFVQSLVTGETLILLTTCTKSLPLPEA